MIIKLYLVCNKQHICIIMPTFEGKFWKIPPGWENRPFISSSELNIELRKKYISTYVVIFCELFSAFFVSP